MPFLCFDLVDDKKQKLMDQSFGFWKVQCTDPGTTADVQLLTITWDIFGRPLDAKHIAEGHGDFEVGLGGKWSRN